MEVDEEGERIPFGCVANGHKKYGSTSRFRRKDSQTMVYKVQKGDTMQGIAVKFGVTTEQIRRTNQMWTNDSLFLRDTLLIPVSPSTSTVSSNQQLNGSCLREAVSNNSSDSSDTEVQQNDSSTSEKPRSGSSLNSSNEATTAV